MKHRKLDEYMELDYPIEIRAIPEELGGGFSACIPHLGRWAFFADGDTPQEALSNLEELKAMLFEDMLERGKEIPLPPPLPEEEAEAYSGYLSLRIPKDLHRQIAQRAKANGCSTNQYMATALAKHVGGEECAQAVLKMLSTLPASKTVKEVWVVNYPPAKELGPGSKREDEIGSESPLAVDPALVSGWRSRSL